MCAAHEEQHHTHKANIGAAGRGPFGMVSRAGRLVGLKARSNGSNASGGSRDT